MKFIFDHPLVRKHGPKFVRFLICGGFGACIDFGSLYFLTHFAHWQPKYALLVCKGLALAFVFVSNRFFTFRGHGGDAKTQAARFFAVYLSAATLNYTLSLTLTTIGIPIMIANALAIGTLMLFNFFFLNFFVFKKGETFSEEVVIA